MSICPRRQCPSFGVSSSQFTSWGIWFLLKLLDDGRGRDRVDLTTLWHSRWVHPHHVKSRPAYAQATYICIYRSPTSSSLFSSESLLSYLLQHFEYHNHPLSTDTPCPTRADPITIKYNPRIRNLCLTAFVTIVYILLYYAIVLL